MAKFIIEFDDEVMKAILLSNAGRKIREVLLDFGIVHKDGALKQAALNMLARAEKADPNPPDVVEAYLKLSDLVIKLMDSTYPDK